MKRIATALTMLVLCGGVALAGPMKPGSVPQSAGWVAHLDLQGFLKSQIGKLILEEANKQEGFRNGMAMVRQTFGFDPLMDVRGVTVYGKQLGDDIAVVMLDATVDQEKLVTMLKGNATYKSTEHGKHTLHQWNEDPKPVRDPKTGEVTSYAPGKRQVGCFYNAETVLIGSSVELLQTAVDTLDAKVPAAKSPPASPLPVRAAGGFLFASVSGIETPAKDAAKPEAAIFRQVRGLAAQAGEADGKLFVDVAALAKSAEGAARLGQIVQGIVAFGQLILQEHPEIPALNEKVDVKVEGGTVRLSIEAPSEAAVKAVRFAVEQAQKAKAAAGTEPAKEDLKKAQSK